VVSDLLLDQEDSKDPVEVEGSEARSETGSHLHVLIEGGVHELPAVVDGEEEGDLPFKPEVAEGVFDHVKTILIKWMVL
jgi:hypothetical protein